MKRITPIIRSLLTGVFFLFLLIASAGQAVADLYVSDLEAGKIYRYTADGVQHTFVSIYQPYCLAFDPANNLYAASYGQSVVYKIRPNGRKSIYAVNHLVVNPAALAVDSAGNLFVSHGTYYPGIDRIKPDGTNNRYVANYDVAGLAVDSADYLYANEVLNSSILKIAPGGAFREISENFGYPGRMAFDSAGNLYVPNNYEGSIYKIAPDGSKTKFATVPYPVALAIDESDYLFVATYDNGAGSIFEFAPDGTMSTFATGLQDPTDLAIPKL